MLSYVCKDFSPELRDLDAKSRVYINWYFISSHLLTKCVAVQQQTMSGRCAKAFIQFLEWGQMPPRGATHPLMLFTKPCGMIFRSKRNCNVRLPVSRLQKVKVLFWDILTQMWINKKMILFIFSFMATSFLCFKILFSVNY